MRADAVQKLSVFGPHGLQLGFERVAGKFTQIFPENKLLYVQLIQDNRPVFACKLHIGADIHGPDGLAVLDVRRIAGRTSQNDDVKDLLHGCFQILVDHFLMDRREIAQMDALRRIFVNAAHQIPVDILGHEGDHGRRRFCNGHKGCVQSHVGIDLVLLHALCPEALPAPSHIPVAHLVHEILKGPCRLGNPVILQIAVHFSHHRVQFGQKPLVHDGEGRIVQHILGRVKLVNVRVQHEERVGIPQGAHEFALSFLHGLSVEPVGQPGRAVDVEIPADRVRAVDLQRVKGVHRISLGFAHLLSVLILHMAEDNDIFIGCLIK